METIARRSRRVADTVARTIGGPLDEVRHENSATRYSPRYSRREDIQSAELEAREESS